MSGHANRKELRFKTAPNYEGQSSYSVTVRVSAAGVTKTRTVPVTVLDGPDTGTITLAPTTTQTCARIVATLRDEDSGLHFNQSLGVAPVWWTSPIFGHKEDVSCHSLIGRIRLSSASRWSSW